MNNENDDFHIDWVLVEKMRKECEELAQKSICWQAIVERDGIDKISAQEKSSRNWEAHEAYFSSLDRKTLEALAMRILADLHRTNWRIDGLEKQSKMHISGREFIRGKFADIRHKTLSRGRKAADAANAPHKANQEAVFEWLETNYRPGYKHADMAAEIEKLVEREYDTILKDITAWKKRKR